MFKNALATLIFFIQLFLINATYAQIKVKLAKTDYIVSDFNTDTLARKAAFINEDSLLLLHRYIKPIKSSKYQLEVRCFYKYNFLNNGFLMIILKGTKHRLWVEEYYLSEVYAVTDNTPSIKVDDKILIAIQVSKYRVSHPNSVLTQLIRSGLFNYPQTYEEHEKFTKHEVEFQDSSDKVIFEVKLNNNYRSFSYGIRAIPHSLEVEATNEGKEIFNTIKELTNRKNRY